MSLISLLARPEARNPERHGRKLSRSVAPNGQELHLESEDIIVSKTDLTGRITYTNRTFMRFAQFSERELLGAPHSIIRHPDMPRCVFKLLWDKLAAQEEVFAYVKNLSRSGAHYWVFAHVTPSFDASCQVIGYHSNRRRPDPRVVSEVITPLYQELLAEEARHHDRKAGMAAAGAKLQALLDSKGVGYDELIFSL